MRPYQGTVTIDVFGRRRREAVSPAQGPEVVVKGMVLHHQQHDVMNPRNPVMARRQ
jgi:hypothetical protein